jgi:heat shock protein HtpX
MATDPRIAQVHRRQRRRNRLHGVLLLTGMVGMLALCAWLLFGGQGVAWVLVLGLGTLALRPRMRPAWVLRMYRARPLPASAAPDLHHLLEVLAGRAGLPRPPALYYVPSRMLNAFAVGDRDASAIGVTDGLLRTLTGRQLAGVIAHEVSHISSEDLRMMTLADTVGRLTHAIAYAGLALLVVSGASMAMVESGGARPALASLLLVSVVLLFVPTVVTLLQLALSRAREYDADLAAATLTGDPLGLADALRTLHIHEGRLWERLMVPHGRSPDQLLLRTHPTAQERIRRLQELAPVDAPPVTPPSDDHPPRGFGPVTRPVRLRAPGIWR